MVEKGLAARQEGAGESQHPPQSRGLIFEALEPRVLMSADLSYGEGAADLTLHFDQQANEFQLLSVDANGQNGNVQSRMDANAALTDGLLSIGGNGLGNTLRLDVSSLQSLNIELLDSGGNDSLIAQADANFTLSGSTLDIAGKSYGLAGFESLSLQGGDSDNAFSIDDWNGSLSLDGWAGNDTLQLNSSANATWIVTGENSGEVNGQTFGSIENLAGAAGNQDQFVFKANGAISGTIDGGAAGFDTLVLDGGIFETVSYIAQSPDSGEVLRDADTIRYAGLEPIFDNTSSTNRVIGLSDNADNDAMLSAASTTELKLSGSTFEGITFINPTQSLTVNGLAGNDIITIASLSSGFNGDITINGDAGADRIVVSGQLDLKGKNFTVDAEDIRIDNDGINTNGSIINAGAVSLHAISSSGSEAAMLGRKASVFVQGDIKATGDVSLIASVTSNIFIDGGSIVGTLENGALRSASVSVNGVTIEAAALTISAKTDGSISTVASGSIIDSWIVKNSFTEEAIAEVSDASVVASSVAISTETSTHYLARGRYAENTINGVSRVRVENSNVNTNGANGVSISALDNAQVISESPAAEYLIDADLPIDISATIARNELTRDVEASVTGSSLEATGEGDIEISATKNVVAAATATATTVSKSLDLTPFGALSFGGTFASNVMQGDVDAYADESTLTTVAGNMTLDASDTSEITALAQTSAESGAGDLSIGGSVLAIGTSIAFNSLGWETQNTALDLVDALIGDPLLAEEAFGGNVGADVRAYLRNTTVDSGGALSVSALADALIESVVTNQTAGTSSSPIFGASSSALGGVVSSNKISGVTEASIYFDGYLDAPTLIADDGFTVAAEDSRAIDATVILTATSETSNPKPLNGVDAMGISGAVALNDVRGGASASIDGATLSASADGVSVSASADAAVRAYLESAASSAGGNNFGQGSSLAAGGLIATNIIQGGAEAYITDSTVGTATDSIGGDVSVDAINSSTIDAHLVNATKSGSQAVTLSLAFNTVGWSPQNILFNTVDTILGDSSVADAFGNEQGAGAKAYLLDSTVVTSGSLAISALNDASIYSDIANTSESSASAWLGATGFSFGGVIASNKVSADAEAFIDWSTDTGTRSISAVDGIDLNAVNSADLSASIALDVPSETVNTALDSNNTSASDAIGIAGAVSYNDVRSGATAFINRAQVLDTAGNLSVEALNSSSFEALVSSSAYSSGGNIFGGGASTAVSPVVSTNTVQGGSEAYISHSIIGTNGPIGGDVSVYALNDMVLSAETNNATASAGLSVSVTLAFNTLGYAPQNILFNLVDTLLGDPLVADAFGNDTGAGAKAYLLDSTVDATGSLSVEAEASAALDSLVSNVADSVSIAYTNATSAGYGFVVSLNKVSSAAEASIGWSSTGDHDISADGGISVSASDTAAIDATISLPVTSVAGNNQNAFSNSASTGIGGGVVLNDVRGGASATIDDAELSSAGNVSVSALADASLKATLEVSVQSLGGSEIGTGAPLAAGGLIATNTVQGGAEAYITNSSIGTETTPIGGDVTIEATNNSTIEAHVLNAISTGAPLLDTDSGSHEVVAGSLVKILEGYANGGNVDRVYRYLGEEPVTLDLSGEDYSVDTNWEELDDDFSGSRAIAVTLAFNTVGWAPQNILFNTIDTLLGDPLVADAFGNEAGAGAKAYLLDSTVDADGQLSVTATNAGAISSDVANTAEANATAFTNAKGFSFGALVSMNKVSASAEASIAWGDSYQGAKTITADTGVTVAASDSAGITSTVAVLSAATSSSTNPFSKDPAVGLGFSIAMNDVRGGAKAFIDEATIDASNGGVSVTADESATLSASNISEATSTGGSIIGGSTSVAVSAVIATNLVLSGAQAYVTNSQLGTVVDKIGGDITVTADNTATIDAEASATVESNGTSVGVTLAFNSIGWESQNFLFNTVDALIGTEIGTENPVHTDAYIQDSTVSTTGGVEVGATLDSAIDATVSASSTSIVENIVGGNSISVGAVITMNRLSSTVSASIDSVTALQAGSGDVWIHAADTSAINAEVSAASVSVATGVKKSTSISVGLSVSRNVIRNEVEAFIKDSGSAATPGKTLDGNVVISASEQASIHSTSTASAAARAIGASNSISFAGGGASAVNAITGKSNATISGSTVIAQGIGRGMVSLDAANTSDISALVKATAESISIGGKGAKAFAIGAAIARNTIGTGDVANEVKARIINSTVTADGDISLTAKADNYIDSTVSASSVAVGVSAKGAPALSIGGVFAENFVATDVEAVIDGFNPLAPDAPLKQIRAKGDTGVSLLASDASRIWADAKAVSVAASLAGSGIAGAISVAFNVALNEIDNDVTANINKVDVDADKGDVVVRAETLEDNNDFTADYQVGTSGNVALKTGDRIEDTDGKVYRFLGYEYNYTTSSTSPVIATDGVLKDEVVVLADGSAYKAAADLTGPVDLGLEDFSIAARWTQIGDDPADFNYSLDALTAEVKNGDIVKIEDGYGNGGVPVTFYRYIGVTDDLDLSDIDYTTSSWQLVTTDINALDGDDFGDDTFWRRDAAITAQATAVSVAASFSGKNALALTGAGAGATNSVLSATNASITRSDVKSAGIVDLDAENTASIDASIVVASAALSFSGKTAVGASIGVAIASNLIGYKENGDFDQAQVRAFIENSKVDATGNLTLDAVATQRIDAFVFAGSAAIAGSGQNAVGLSGAGVSATNKISMAVEAYIGGDSALARNDIDAAAVLLNASDHSSIIAKAAGASLAGAFAGKNAVALSIAVSLARNTIDNDVAAYIAYADIDAAGGNVELRAEETASIDALSVAASLSLAASGKIAGALSGAGADATNSILTKTNAYIANSNIVGTAGTSGANNVIVEAENTSSIKATIAGASAAIAGSGKVAAGASIGVALARNLIGWNLDSNNDATVNDPAEVQAYVQNSSINAADDLTLAATSENSIDALVLAFSVAIAGGGNVAVGLTGAGSRSENKLATKTKAFIKGSGASGIVADSVSLSAEDRSKITADVAAASLGIAGSGSISGSVSVGVSLAQNHLSNEIEATIDSADVTSRTGDITVTANSAENSSMFPFDYVNSGSKALTTGDKVKVNGGKVYRFLGEQYQYTSNFDSVTLKTNDIVKVADDFSGNGIAGAFYKAKAILNNQAVGLVTTNYNDTTKWQLISQNLATEDYSNQERWKQDSSISALSIATSLSAGLSGSVGLALSGAGAESTNVILSKTNAYIKDSTLSSAGNVVLSAENTASIDATVVAASAAIGASGSIGVGASIGAAVARNLMGWDVNDTHAFDHTSTDVVSTLNDGDKVKIVGAAGAGDIYEYDGLALGNADLKLQDFTDSSHWQLISRGNAVQAFAKNSSIDATDDLLLTSLSNQTINSFVLAGSAAVGAAGSVGLAASGAGVRAENKLATEVRSFIDGDGTNGIVADYILLTADDESRIKVDAVGASLAVGAGGSGGGALSIGVSLAFNHISNVVEASISHADNVTTRGGQDWTTASGQQTVDKGTRVQLAANYAGGGIPGAVYEYAGSAGLQNLATQNYSDSALWRRLGEVSLRASENSSIDAVSVAASLAVGAGGAAGLAFTGAGAEATNVILTKTNAFFNLSNVNTSASTSAGDVILDAQNNASINATIAGASVAVGGGGAAGIGVAIGAALARNLVGWDVDSNGDVYQDSNTTSTVLAYTKETSINAKGDLIQTALADQTIDAVVVAVSLAVAGGGGFGGAGAGSGTHMDNRIAGNSGSGYQ